jgi:hypothetical protein
MLEIFQLNVDGTVDELVAMVRATTDAVDWKQETVTPLVPLVQVKPELSKISDGKVMIILSPE